MDNCLKHLDGVEVLIEKDLLDGAVILLGFAIEEFGRAVYLRERLQKGLESIEEALEKSHKLKYEKAFSVLPNDLQIIWFKSFYSSISPMFPLIDFPHAEEIISPSTRLKPVYLHFDEKTQMWHRGIIADKEKLKWIVNEIREYVVKFKF